MLLRNGIVFNVDQSFVAEDGTQYPAGFFRNATAEQRTAVGITEVADTVQDKNENFWFVSLEADGTFNAIPKPISDAKDYVKSQVAARRFGAEIQGVTLNGTSIATDRDSQSMIGNAYASLKNGLIASVNFKSQSGFVSLDLASFEPVARAVAEHIQACFTAEQVHVAAIDALTTHAEVEAYDISTGWPA